LFDSGRTSRPERVGKKIYPTYWIKEKLNNANRVHCEIMFRKIMKPISFIPIVFLALLTGCAGTGTYGNQKIVERPFPIAGGQIVKLRATSAGFIPAQDDQFKIEVAGFLIGPKKDQPQSQAITWIFGFTSKTSEAIEDVTVEEVSPSDPAVLILHDGTPKLKADDWSGSSEAADVSREAQPWLYSDKTSVFVFRFTIKAKGAAPRTLYQATSFSGAAKTMLLQHKYK
jgi:hypothetical protein